MKAKINVVDIIIMVVVIFMILGGYYKFYGNNKVNKNVSNDTLQYKLKVSDIRDVTVNAIKEQDVIFNSEKNNVGNNLDVSIGKVIKKDIEPMKDKFVTKDGKVINVEKPNRYIMNLTIETKGKESDKGYFANGNIEIKKGTMLYIKTNKVFLGGYILDIKNINK